MAESTFRLTEKESLTVERLSYIYESNKAVATILSRELADAENPDAKEMLREVCNSCRHPSWKCAWRRTWFSVPGLMISILSG